MFLRKMIGDPKLRWTALFALIFLAPSMFGFVTKFIEFINTFRTGSDGVFAVTPMVNYLAASAGFMCLLVWSGVNGAFSDIEAPKRTMLELDDMLDRNSGQTSTHA